MPIVVIPCSVPAWAEAWAEVWGAAEEDSAAAEEAFDKKDRG